MEPGMLLAALSEKVGWLVGQYYLRCTCIENVNRLGVTVLRLRI